MLSRSLFAVDVCIHFLVLFVFVEAITKMKRHDFIALYEIQCDYTNGLAHAIITTDMPDPKPFAVCSNEEKDFDFVPLNEVQWELEISFDEKDSDSKCVFVKSTNDSSYFIDVYVPENPNMITINMEQKRLECVKGTDETLSDGAQIGSGMGSLKEAKQYKSEPSKTKLRLYVTNILRQRQDEAVPVGAWIRLNAEMMDYYPDEKSFKIMSCSAFGGNISYTFLKSGCGNGQIIPKNVGFITYKRIAKSVYFPAFRLPGTRVLSFSCSYVICKSSCDGSSCQPTNRRVKREATDHWFQDDHISPDNGSETTSSLFERVDESSRNWTNEVQHSYHFADPSISETTLEKILQLRTLRKQLHNIKSQICLIQTEVVIALCGPVVICIIGVAVAYFFLRRVRRQIAENRCCSSYSSLDTTFLYKLDDSLAMSDENLCRPKCCKTIDL